MKILDFDTSRLSSDLLKELEGRKFFAISIVDGVFEFHIPDDMMKSQIVYGCEFLKYLTVKDSIISREDEDNG